MINLKNHVSDNKKLYKNGVLVIGSYLVTRMLIKKFALTPVEYKSKIGDKDLDIDINLSNKDKERIKDYFNKIELFFDSYFLKKYSSYFKCIDYDKKDELKNIHQNQDMNQIIFPVSYYKIKENSSLVSFLRDLCLELGIETQEYDYNSLVNLIKEYYKTNSHRKILRELKEFINDQDLGNWERLYESKPISILN